MIYVRSKEGRVLMPTERCGKIGYLLRHGKAHVVSRVPFVVQLDYDSTTYTQDVNLGIDAGSKHIGVSASSEKKELFAAQVELRSDIVKLLSTRRELRRTRRNRKTGGNSPSNLVTLCETCHKAYHRGEFDLKIKRGTILRDAAVMNIMRLAVYERAKAEFGNVHLTYGYITKHTRIENGIAKTHAADAFCIAKNVHARKLDSFFMCRCVPRHTRALHVANPKKGGIRRSAIASHKIGKSCFQRFDMVRWKGRECFISGSTGGRPVLRDIEGVKMHDKQAVNVKTIKFLKRLKNNILVEEKDFRKLNKL